jgi:hypothetical protein
MSNEILTVLEYMEKEKGIPRAEMIATIVNALKTAAQKGVNSGQELRIEHQSEEWAASGLVAPEGGGLRQRIPRPRSMSRRLRPSSRAPLWRGP